MELSNGMVAYQTKPAVKKDQALNDRPGCTYGRRPLTDTEDDCQDDKS